MDLNEVAQILAKNNQKNFVKRIIFPDNKPSLDVGDGEIATHRMAWGESDGKFYVFPTIMQEEDGTLRDYGDKAFDEAIRRKEFIKFDDPQKADQFSQEYKKYWEGIGYKP